MKALFRAAGTRPEIPALVLLFVLALTTRLDFLFVEQFARGADGYYYAAQVKHFLERGGLFGSDSSLILRWLILFTYITPGADIIASNKIAIAVLGALLVPAAFLLGRNLSAGTNPGNTAVNNALGLVLAAFFTSVSPAVWFHLEFVKNLGGIVLFTLFAALLFPALDGKRFAVIAAAICLVLTLLSHKLMGGFALIFAAAGMALAGAKALHARSARVFRLLVAGSAGLLLVLLLLGVLFPGVLALADFSRFENLFTWPPRFHVTNYFHFINPPATHRLEFYIMALAPLPLLFMFAVDALRRRLSPAWFASALFFLMFVICMNPVLEFRGLDFSFRLLITIFVPAGALLVLPAARLPGRAAAWGGYLLVLCLAAYQMSAFRAFPIRAKVDYSLYDKVVPLLVLPRGSLLIAHQSLDNFYYYQEGEDAFRFMPEAKHFNRPVFRLAWGVSTKDIRRWMPRDARPRFLPGRYLLLREKDWERFMNRLPPARRRVYRNWKNPHRFRPGFMRGTK